MNLWGVVDDVIKSARNTGGTVRRGVAQLAAETADMTKSGRGPVRGNMPGVTRYKTVADPTASAAYKTASAARSAEVSAAWAAKGKTGSNVKNVASGNVRAVRAAVSPVMPIARLGGKAVVGLSKVNTAKYSPQIIQGIAAAGVVAGVAGGIRSSLRDINSSVGDPMGAYASLGVKTAFMGNPGNSRSKNNGASGKLTLRSGR